MSSPSTVISQLGVWSTPSDVITLGLGVSSSSPADPDAIASILTLGYGAWGSVADVILLGYGPGIPTPDDDEYDTTYGTWEYAPVVYQSWSHAIEDD